jgi:Rap1a immunity proteins
MDDVLRLALVLVACSTPIVQAADYYSDNDLYEGLLIEDAKDATNPQTAYNTGYAMGYVLAAFETSNGDLFCMPKEVTIRQTNDVVLAYLRDHPAERHLPAVFLVEHAH